MESVNEMDWSKIQKELEHDKRPYARALAKRIGDEKLKMYSYSDIHPKTLDDLEIIIKKAIDAEGLKCDLNWIDTSNIDTMDGLFFEFDDFNGDISGWDVSNVKSMRQMFNFSKFNGDISKWDVSNVKDMFRMFADSKFNGDISEWDVSNVKSMFRMFADSKFNGDISKWDVSNVKDMDSMFADSKFNGDISKWDVSNVKDMECMFADSKFNGDISGWDVSNVVFMDEMFSKSIFSGDISNWKVNKRCSLKGFADHNSHIKCTWYNFESKQGMTSLKNFLLESFK